MSLTPFYNTEYLFPQICWHSPYIKPFSIFAAPKVTKNQNKLKNLFQHLVYPWQHQFCFKIMILWIDINYLEECIQINALGYSIYLLSVFRVGKLLIMIERKIIRFTYYPIGFLYQLKVTVKSSFGTNNRAGSQGSDQIRKIKLCQETRYQMLDRIRKRSPPVQVYDTENRYIQRHR